MSILVANGLSLHRYNVPHQGRLHSSGARPERRISTGQAPHGIDPDLICFGKSLANGHPLSVAMGREALREAAEEVFISGTFWFAPAPMAAAMATLQVLEETDAVGHMARLGARLGAGLEAVGSRHGFQVTVSGPLALPYMTFAGDEDLGQMRAFCREMIARGVFLHPHHNWFLCAAHTEEDIEFVLEMGDEAFGTLGSGRLG